MPSASRVEQSIIYSFQLLNVQALKADAGLVSLSVLCPEDRADGSMTLSTNYSASPVGIGDNATLRCPDNYTPQGPDSYQCTAGNDTHPLIGRWGRRFQYFLRAE